MFPSITQILSAIAPLALFVASQSTTVDYCELLGDVISICQIETPGFTQLPASSQASCLCGTTLGTIPWGPATFDAFATECAVQYATIDATIASDASLLASFCISYTVGAGGARSSAFSLSSLSTTARSTGIVSTGIVGTATATSRSSLSGGGASSTTASHTSSITSSTPATTTVISVVTIAPTTSASSSSHNAAVKDAPQGLNYIICNVILEVLVLAAFM